MDIIKNLKKLKQNLYAEIGDGNVDTLTSIFTNLL